MKQAKLQRHARQRGVDLGIVFPLQSFERFPVHHRAPVRLSDQNGAHIQAAMDKLQARFKLAI